MKETVGRLLRWFTSDQPEPTPEPVAKLIHRVDFTVDATCPCGSQSIVHLTLMTTVDCPRCGRTMAIRAIEYHRTTPAAVPDLRISIGWVQSDAMLRQARTRGVH